MDTSAAVEVKKARRARPARSIAPVAESTDGSYIAYSIHRKANTGGLFIMRRLTISGTRVIKSEDTVEDFASILISRIENEIETGLQ